MARESERKELWHQLDNESDRAHEAFKVFMYLPPAERSIARAWREWSGNPDAKREPPYFAGWARDFAWSDRARAHDHHLELLRESGMEEAVKEESKRQARAVEKLHWRYQELMAVGYERAMEYLESAEFVKHLRPSDVVALIKLHAEGVYRLGEGDAQGPESGVDWTEDEQRELDQVVGEIEALAAQEEPEGDSEDGEGDYEQSEDGQD